MTMHEPRLCSQSALNAPIINGLEGNTIDPAMGRVVVRVAPYPGMACGDKVVLIWAGLDADGLGYRHEIPRFISEGRVGQEVVFVVKNVHLAALDGGELDLCWTLSRATQPVSVTSARLLLDVGDVNVTLLPAIIDDAVGGTLDPDRVPYGASITLKPYPRMTAGDRISLSWQGSPPLPALNDRLTVETFAVGQPLGFWVAPEAISPHVGHEITVRYQVEQAGANPRDSQPATVLIAPLQRGPLRPPDVLEAQDGVLDLDDTLDGITVVIDDARAEAGELVYLQCDGELFSHRDDREITHENVGESLVFIVPYRFWREHEGTDVRVSFQVERLDDTSQVSEAMYVHVQASEAVRQPSGL